MYVCGPLLLSKPIVAAVALSCLFDQNMDEAPDGGVCEVNKTVLKAISESPYVRS